MNPHESAVCQAVAHCMDLDDQKLPTIEYGDEEFNGYSSKVHGLYIEHLDMIAIRPEWNGVDGLVAHECVHAHLKRRTGDLDAAHKSPYFRACAPKDYIGP